MQEVGKLVLQIPEPHLPTWQRICDVEVVFGDTELKMTAIYRNTGARIEGYFEFACT